MQEPIFPHEPQKFSSRVNQALLAVPSMQKSPQPGNRPNRDRLRREKRALLKLSKSRTSRSRNIQTTFRQITRIAVRCLEVSRVGIWLLSPDGKLLRCHQLFDAATDAHASGTVVEVLRHPRYFKSLTRELTVAANNVQTDRRLKEFWEDYMLPHGIQSSLDAAIRSNGVLIGVICLEARKRRKWTSDEEQFAASLTEIAALAIKDAELRRTETLTKSFSALGKKLNACTTPRMAVQLIGKTAQKLWGWDALYLHLYDHASDRLLPVLALDTINGRKVQVPLDPELPNAQARRFLSEKKLLINGVSPGTYPLVPFGDVTRPSQSRMFITIRKNDRILALLSIQSYSANTYDERALDGLEALGEYCTGAVARLQAEALRRESEERFRSLAEATTEGILIHSQTRIYEVNAKLVRLFGYTADQLKTKSLNDLLARSGRGTRSRIQMLTSREAVGIRNDGGCFPLEIVTRPSRYMGKPAKVTVIRDISERKRLEQHLREHSRQILDAQESERHRVSRDLHDSVNQLLTAAQFSLETLANSLNGPPSRSRNQLEKTRELVAKAMEEIRNISWNLRPNELDDLGLPVAIKTLCHDCQERTGITVHFDLPDSPFPLNKSAAVTLFRIVQEGLSNACRHSAASRIDVTIQQTKANLVMEIADDGVGFSPAEISPIEGKKSGLGLLNMRERASSTGGQLELRSSPGNGTRIRLSLPLVERADPHPPHLRKVSSTEAPATAGSRKRSK